MGVVWDGRVYLCALMEKVRAPSMAASSSREGSATRATAAPWEGSDEEGVPSTSILDEDEEDEEDGADVVAVVARTPRKIPRVTARGVCCKANGSGSRSSDECVTTVRTVSNPAAIAAAAAAIAASPPAPPVAAEGGGGRGRGRKTTLVSGFRKARNAAMAANSVASMTLPPV